MAQEVPEGVLDGKVPLDRASVAQKLMGRINDSVTVEINYHRLLMLQGIKPPRLGHLCIDEEVK
jgi:hypothetical protein